MALTAEQRQRLEWLLEGHLDDDADDETIEQKWAEQFAALSSAEELFLFAYHSTGDLSAEEWQRVIDNTLCDQGTALLVFWRNSPGRLYQFASREEVHDSSRDRYDLLKEIESRYLGGGFPSRAIRFDPADFRGHNLLTFAAQEGGLQRVPPQLRQASPGESVPLLW